MAVMKMMTAVMMMMVKMMMMVVVTMMMKIPMATRSGGGKIKGRSLLEVVTVAAGGLG